MRTDRYKIEEPKKKKRGLLKALLFLILFLIIAIAAATAYFYKTAADSISLTFKDDAPSIEFGTDCHVMDFVESSEGEITTGSVVLDTETVGPHQMTYTVTKPVFGGILNPSEEFVLDYTVTDSTTPLMIWSGDGTVLQNGTEFNINDIIAYGDNADPDPSVDVEGKVDMKTNGDYPLHVTITDASGNSEEWDLTVTVADSLPVYEDTAERTAFKDFRSAYEADGRSFGIDVSAWQDEVDFDAVKKSGCEFVMIRIGYGSGEDINIDKQFYSNISAARHAGLKVGVYFYSYDSNENDVRASAAWIIKTLGEKPLDLPVAFDWEDFGVFQSYDMSFYGLNKLYDAFAGEITAAGYDCMLYGSKNYLEKIWTDTKERPVWLAHYTDKTDYGDPYMMWQASCTGRINGIKGDVDMDILYE